MVTPNPSPPFLHPARVRGMQAYAPAMFLKSPGPGLELQVAMCDLVAYARGLVAASMGRVP